MSRLTYVVRVANVKEIRTVTTSSLMFLSTVLLLLHAYFAKWNSGPCLSWQGRPLRKNNENNLVLVLHIRSEIIMFNRQRSFLESHNYHSILVSI